MFAKDSECEEFLQRLLKLTGAGVLGLHFGKASTSFSPTTHQLPATPTTPLIAKSPVVEFTVSDRVAK